ncbi:MAG: alkaline phosphatase D family protein [Opitutaceae bacterium]
MLDKLLNRNLLSRRRFILAGASIAAAPLLRSRVFDPIGEPEGGLFSLGVASGDPLSDGFVLWTRLAPRPNEPGGGMSPEPVEVSWEVAEDESMNRIVRKGIAVAEAAWAHSVHVEIAGLPSDRWFWYRFRAGPEVSPTGRTRTLPREGALPERLNFAFASCQKYEMGYYTAYEHMAREDLDLVVFLGDYIYEDEDSSKGVRPHGLEAIRTLDDYRLRYAVYKSDRALQKAHAMAPWIVTWDDHEVENDYAGDVPKRPEDYSESAFLQRRADAYRAYYEHMPLRSTARPSGPDLTLYRRFDYGRLARFHVLDTRQYRSNQPSGPRRQPFSPALEDPTVTMLGTEQRLWLADGLSHSPAIWNILAQQVLMAPVDLEPGSETSFDVDKWSGYGNERRWLLSYLREANVSNPVVLTGDLHENWANELWIDADQDVTDPVAVELVGTSISSSGNGVGEPDYLAELLAENPWVKFHNDRRGYVRCRVTPAEWRVDFQTVPYIDRRGAPLETSASFLVASGDSHLHRAPGGPYPPE